MVPDPAISADRMHVQVELKSFYSTAIDFKNRAAAQRALVISSVAHELWAGSYSSFGSFR
jgi:hypothetical protein